MASWDVPPTGPAPAPRARPRLRPGALSRTAGTGRLGSVPPPDPGTLQPPQWDVPATPPAAAVGWGAPRPRTRPPGPPGQWGAPPPQPGGWGPAPGTPGRPPPGAWNPQPAQSGNGCLKACLIVGGVLVVLGIIGIIGIVVLSLRFADDLGVDSDGSMRACELITNEELGAALGSGADALPMGGLVDSTVGLRPGPARSRMPRTA